jgi:uncharacterized protein
MIVVRPVVRSFRDPFFQEAVAWVRSGGHSVVRLSPHRTRLVFARPRRGDDFDLGWWAVLDMGRLSFKVAKPGTMFEGLAYVAVPHDCYAIVHDRIVRDSIHPGPTRAIDLDCLACGSCCRDNKVELDDEDLARFAKAGRPELGRPPFARRQDGVVVLVLQKDRRCKHLADDNRCGIYDLRPYSCSRFPVGSECCLSAREEEMGIVDGLKE